VNRLLLCLLPCLFIAEAATAGQPATASKPTELQAHRKSLAGLDARTIIGETQKRHELYPFVYEEWTLVLMDDRRRRDVRRMRRYSRLEENGMFRSLLRFDFPASIAGTTLLFTRKPNSGQSTRIFLPALGARMVGYAGTMRSGQILGSEFSIEDLMPEDTQAFDYQRLNDVVDHGHAYFVIEATARNSHETAYARRRLFVRQDNFFITRIDYFSPAGRLLKRQSRHDIHAVGGMMWRADIITVLNLLNGYRSILKIDKRVFSRDYVSPSIFSEKRLLALARPAESGKQRDDTGQQQ